MTIRVRRRRSVGMALVVTAVAVGMVSACSSSGSSSGGGSGGVQHLTFWSAGKQSTITYLQNTFNASHKDVQVTGQYIASSDELGAKEIAAIKSGTEPNVIIGQDPSALPQLAESGKVVDLSSALTTETAALYPGIRSALTYQGKQLGFALGGVGDYALFYNKTMFKAAGISQPPATWADVMSDAVKLTVPSKDQYGIYIPLGSSEWISYSWEGLLWANGGDLLSPDGKSVAFDSQAGVDALTTWVDLVQKLKAAPSTSYAQAGSYDGAPAFAGRKVAMIIEGQFALDPFRSAGIDFGVAPFPKGTQGTSTGIGIGVASVYDHGSKANSAAEQFVQWLGQPDQGGYLTGASSGLPSAPNQLDTAPVKKLQSSDATYSVFADQLKTGRTRPTIPAYAAISQALSDQIYAALRGTISPSDALQKAAAAGNAALKNGS